MDKFQHALSTCDPQASLEHVVERPGVIIVELQQRVVFEQSRPPAAGIALQRADQVSTHKTIQRVNGRRLPLTFTATDWAWRSQGGRMARGRVTSQ